MNFFKRIVQKSPPPIYNARYELWFKAKESGISSLSREELKFVFLFIQETSLLNRIKGAVLAQNT